MCNKDDLCRPRRQAPPLPRPEAEQAIVSSVRTFYERVAADPELNELVDNAIPDLDTHIALVGRYWTSVLFGPDQHRGHYAPHVAFPSEPRCLLRWHRLFVETIFERLPVSMSGVIIARAEHLLDEMRAGRYVAEPYLPAPTVH